jgi:hypothetical protein
MLIGRSGDRPSLFWGGKSELHRTGCWLTARRGNPTESGTETYRFNIARVKSGGKSSRLTVVTQQWLNPTWSKAE